MFSPIPFLHDDARRSKSRSPPPSPLVLPALASSGVTPQGSAGNADPPALGLVDELDDPSPGHLSDHPQPLSSTTSISDSKPVATLAARFVKSTEEVQEGPSTRAESAVKSEEMAVDDPEKENKSN